VRASPVEPFGKLPRRVLPNPAPSSTPRGDRPPARARGCDVVHVALADDRPLPHRRRLPSLSPPRGAPPPIAGYPSWWCCRCTLNSPSPRPARRCVFWRSFSGMTSTYCPCHTRSFPLGIRCGAVVESRALFPTQPPANLADPCGHGTGRQRWRRKVHRRPQERLAGSRVGRMQRPGYVRAMADLIQAERNRAFAEPEKAVIFFSAHGVPVCAKRPAATRLRSQ